MLNSEFDFGAFINKIIEEEEKEAPLPLAI